MGRLFWKFFLFFWLAQLTAVIGVAILIELKHQAPDRTEAIDASPPAAFVVAAAAATLRHGGADALRELMTELRHQPGPPLVAISDAGEDMLRQSVPQELIASVRQLAATPGPHHAIEQISDREGHNYLLFVPPHQRPPEHGAAPHQGPPGPPPPPPHGRSPLPPPLPPLMPILAGGLVCLFFAAGLAWYFAQPIRKLRNAFEAVAEGRLEPQLAEQMGQRRDELADLGRDFDRMVLRLKSLMGSQRHLLHDVSHELRSPLARLQAAIGLLRQQPEMLERSVTRIELEAERMDKLVSELLTLSRLEAGMAGPLDETIDLHELLGHVVDDARFEASAQNVKVHLLGGPNAFMRAFVRGNAELLHRAIENIVRNALKHSPPGACVDISMTAADKQIRITVEDNGPGVPESDLALIFKPFYRSTATGSPDGHGLGLAISSRVVESLKGSISAVNRQGGGFAVSISVPEIERPDSSLGD